MPTILRFRSFRVVIYTADHGPPHVHVLGPDREAIFFISRADRSVTVRSWKGMNQSELTMIAKFLQDNLESVCMAWEQLYGDPAAI